MFENAKILLLDEPLAAMGVKEGAMILETSVEELTDLVVQEYRQVLRERHGLA